MNYESGGEIVAMTASSESFRQGKQQKVKQKHIEDMQETESMREEYVIENLNPRKNPYSKRLKKQINGDVNLKFEREQAGLILEEQFR